MVAEVYVPRTLPCTPSVAWGRYHGSLAPATEAPWKKIITIISQRCPLPLGMCGPIHPGVDTQERSADPSRLYWQMLPLIKPGLSCCRNERLPWKQSLGVSRF